MLESFPQFEKFFTTVYVSCLVDLNCNYNTNTKFNISVCYFHWSLEAIIQKIHSFNSHY